jgi:Holliday junction DNA helicase RuvA
LSLSLIAGLAGTVEGKTLDRVLVRAGGFVLAVAAPLPTLAQLVPGSEVALHTHLIVREDDLALFGFLTSEERDLFVVLLGVSGVGARLGLALLSTLSPEAICRAILSEDADRLARTPGIGKKMAQRIVLELKAPIAKLMANAPAIAATGSVTAASPADTREADAVEALTGLGYSAAEAQAALRAIPNAADLSLDELIVRALRVLAR